jgi:hypothetical protein
VTLGHNATIVPETSNAPGDFMTLVGNSIMNKDRTSFFSVGSIQLTISATGALQAEAVRIRNTSDTIKATNPSYRFSLLVTF